MTLRALTKSTQSLVKVAYTAERAALSTLTLEQLAKLSGYGAIIMPISSPLYFVPKTVDEYVSAFTDKVLGVIGAREQRGWRSEELE